MVGKAKNGKKKKDGERVRIEMERDREEGLRWRKREKKDGEGWRVGMERVEERDGVRYWIWQ